MTALATSLSREGSNVGIMTSTACSSVRPTDMCSLHIQVEKLPALLCKKHCFRLSFISESSGASHLLLLNRALRTDVALPKCGKLRFHVMRLLERNAITPHAFAYISLLEVAKPDGLR